MNIIEFQILVVSPYILAFYARNKNILKSQKKSLTFPDSWESL